MVWPLWATRYLPIEDLPQHVAAIRVLHSFTDPRFGFEPFFELQLLRTQYLAYYLLVDGLAYLIDLELANRLVVIACAAATPFALLYLLRALGRPRELALFALPLTYNAHLILGFINFLMAIPAALFGLGLAARQAQHATWGRALGLALVAVFTFFCHVVPFGFLLLGVGLLSLGRDLRRTLRLCSPLVPSLALGVIWALQSPAGQATLTAAGSKESTSRAIYQPAAFAWRDLPNWLIDVLHGPEGKQLLIGVAALYVLALVFGLSRLLPHRLLGSLPPPPPTAAKRFLLLTPLAPLAALAYFVAPTGYDWIWPIAQRFPLLALLFVVPVLPRQPRIVLWVIATALLCLSWREQTLVRQAFTAFDTQEVGELDAALASIPEGRRVMGLIYARGSRYVKFSPFIHYVAYYQARKGGAVMFTFADFPQSPFRFREGNRPPRVPPRWEWLPQRVRSPDMAWYEYVLVRGGPDPCAGRCTLRFRQGAWSVWQRS
ncbi:MAG: hypothetical protein ABW321_22810 [Polyangiales bacterium]